MIRCCLHSLKQRKPERKEIRLEEIFKSNRTRTSSVYCPSLPSTRVAGRLPYLPGFCVGARESNCNQTMLAHLQIASLRYRELQGMNLSIGSHLTVTRKAQLEYALQTHATNEISVLIFHKVHRLEQLVGKSP